MEQVGSSLASRPAADLAAARAAAAASPALAAARRRRCRAEPPLPASLPAFQVTWARGNALEPATYAHHLQGALGAISCIGGFGNQEQMLKVGCCWGTEPAGAAGAVCSSRRSG
jgi:hypothetical protein